MSTTMKKKLMLIVPMLHQGGFERVAVTTARLLEEWFDIYIVIFNSADIAYDIKGLNIIDLHLGATDSTFHKIINVFLRSRKVRRLKKDMGIDIAYSFGPTANLVNVLSGKRTKIWCGIRSYMDMGNPGKIRLFAKCSDLLLCCSKTIEDEIRTKYGCNHAVTLYNPLDVETVRSMAQQEDERRKLLWNVEDIVKHKTFASMGREDDVKGFWHLLKAFSVVYQKDSQAKLLIIGEGAFEEYQELARQLGIFEAVYFTGVQKNPFQYLKLAGIYVLTSYNEGFPNALIEGMALGMPVIATDCMTGPAEILIGGKGILTPNMSPVKNMNPEEISEEEYNLACRMEELMQDREAYDKYAALSLERAADFSNEKYVKEILGLAGM